MKPKELLVKNLDTLQKLILELQNSNLDIFYDCAELLSECLQQNKTIFWCGNGGSAAESSHLSTELIGRFKINRMPLNSISLNADTTAITCIANDFGFQEIFARQLEGLAKRGDLLIILSTSGESDNIIRVLEKGRTLGVHTIALLGGGGGRANSLADYSIVVNSFNTARIQELHLLLGHTLCEYGENLVLQNL
jgi:D-sedoheptulose 7-phosphate isomerase